MSGDVTPSGSSHPRLAADLIAQRGFMVVRRGYDQDEVRAFLDQVAAEVRTLQRQAEEVPAPPPDIPPAPPAPPAERPPLDEETVVALVGEETANVLRAARAAAGDLRRRAQAEAERIVDEARQSSGDMRQEAEALLSGARRDAEAVGEDIVGAARADADQLLAKARADADTLREQAEQERRLTVDGAQAVREKILGDLSRRRRVATVQIEQLRAGRERLLESYAVVRRTLEEVHDELQRADSEARAAADDAGRRAEAESGPDTADPPSGTAPPGSAATAPPGSAATAPVASPGADLPPPTPEPVTGEPGPGGPVASAWSGESGGRASPAPPAAAGPAGASALGPAPAVSTGLDAGVVVAGDGIERVRVLRPGWRPAGAGLEPAPAERARTGAPALRPMPGGRIAAGGEAPVVLAAEPLTEPLTEPVTEPVAEPVAERPEPPAADPLPEPQLAEPQLAEPQVVEPGPVDPEDLASGAQARRRLPGAAGVFERIRAERQASVEAARRVLAGPAGSSPSAARTAAATASASATGAGAGAGAGEEDLEAPRSDEDEALLQRRDAAVGDIEAALTKKLKRTLQDEQNDLLDRLRGIKGAPTAAALLPDAAEHAALLSEAALPLLDRAAHAGAAFHAEPAAADLAGLAADAAADLAANLVTPLRRRLAEAVRDSAGDEQAVLVEAIGAVYRESKTQRVEPAVLDGVAAAFCGGIYQSAAPGTPLRWVVEDTGGPCPDCDDNALAGFQPRGEVFPTGQLHPPAHAGCRCLLSRAGPA